MELLELVALLVGTVLVTVITALARRGRQTPTEVNWFGAQRGGRYAYDDKSDRTDARPFDRVL